MLKEFIPEAIDTLQQLDVVSKQYEHRIDVVQDYIEDLQRTLEALHAEHEDVLSAIESLDYDVDCVINDEDTSGYHMHELSNGTFKLPVGPSCDCTMCRLDAFNKRFTQE